MLCENTGVELSMILNSMPLEQIDEILFLDNEFPSNAYPYLVQEKQGTKISQIPAKSFYQDPIHTLSKYKKKGPQIFALSWVSYLNGYRTKLKEISEFCQSNGIYFFVDGTQAAGIIPLDLSEVHIDVFIASAYKWIRSSNGTAFARIHPSLLKTLTPSQAGWLSVDYRPEIRYPLALEFPESASKFESGNTNLMGLIALNQALSDIQAIGIENIYKNLQLRTNRILTHIQNRSLDCPIQYLKEHMAGIICFESPSKGNSIYQTLIEQNIWVTYRNHLFRVAAHHDTPLKDIDTFFDVFDSVTSS